MTALPTTLVADERRFELAKDPVLGAGNFLDWALKASPAPQAPILSLERELETFTGEKFRELSLEQLARLAHLYARLYKKLGVRAADPVFVYLDDGVEYLIHYLALTHLGAIGVLTNGNMDPRIAAVHARNVGVAGIFTDASHIQALRPLTQESGYGFIVTEADLRGTPEEALPTYRRHEFSADDPIMIAHSSGTTGIPKAVLLQHERFFHGVRYRLGVPRVAGGERILSSLPHSHNCAIAYIMLALLSGTPVYIASDHSGRAVLGQIDTFKPSMVVSFPQTYVEMTECEMDAFDLSSVNLWFNGGDAAHESHIRALIRHGFHEQNGQRQPGSVFIDGMGSSEMGFSLFRHVHTLKTNLYNRCVGRPLEWVDAQILSEEGEKLPPFQVGRLGVKAPSVTTGYWNNSLLTYRSRLSGYFLTGDLAYRDEEGRFFHVDRTPDVILTPTGPVYGLQTEELLLSRFAAIADCAVFGEEAEGSGAIQAVAYVRIRPSSNLSRYSASVLTTRFNQELASSGLPTLGGVLIVGMDAIPLGTTGKVLKRVLRMNETPAHAAIGRLNLRKGIA
ncbi:class I adenylate-forming enzyme family protein [Stigmatella sp. ncwal1]|uniref:Class I adenylate-forming enzyme family protein n=1 Tax=Stigmatella ashevillensis TaxID=2995309 RepID=A0ABT5DMP0_9BACT|nr:class I adenylate-forming enzyme family protein [Stigmatella ashevillena]MDC0713626.1 class I adenylate-forming enzyme family protein [Stigmatella ashevillena]